MRALGGRYQRSGNNSPRFRGNSKRRSLCQHHVDPRPFDPSRPTSAQGQAKERAAGALRRHQLWPLRRLHRGYDEAEVDRLAVLPKLSMLPSSEGAKSVPKATSSSQPLHQPAASPFVLLGGTMPRRDGGPRALILPWRAFARVVRQRSRGAPRHPPGRGASLATRWRSSGPLISFARTALRRSWMLVQRAFWQSASVCSRSLHSASPCLPPRCSVKFQRLDRLALQPHGEFISLSE